MKSSISYHGTRSSICLDLYDTMNTAKIADLKIQYALQLKCLHLAKSLGNKYFKSGGGVDMRVKISEYRYKVHLLP